MSQQDNFVGGFLVGAVVGGVVGGIVGVLVGSRLSATDSSTTGDEPFPKLDARTGKGKKVQLKASTEQSIEVARRGLEDKIAQLNDAIDDVRQQLSGVNGAPKETTEQAVVKDT